MTERPDYYDAAIKARYDRPPDTATETPRMNAATLAKYQHDERMAAAMKPGRVDRPSFTLKRSTASGSLGVIAIDVDVPVCDEFPTADEAFAAAKRYMDDFCAAYPLPDGQVRAK